MSIACLFDSWAGIPVSFFDNEAMASIMESKKEKSPKTNYGLGPS
ncbi:hypothetical protein VITU9109_02282 [Vibrio tubiashii ATCC 19109]|uniref:Uncharacterized protein n=1 Tax=Vibrio tubiashii ATCC 19109 TaxID=1051646 RepID=A0ABN0DKA7_9VIBR|nr:hypothetical protein VITU9109_02282 [Vibrio tubiashii ATCC 19109]